MTRYRRLPLQGLSNVRDLGGFATANGGITAYGQFIRSEMPASLTEEDLHFLEDYGIGMSIDFRGETEIQRFPSRLKGLPWLGYHHCPVFNADVAQGAIPQEESGSGNAFVWHSIYIRMVEEHKPWFRRTLTLAAECPSAVHYHCTTGKDRTGLFSMALLGLCGVSNLDIIADYAVSQIYLEPLYTAMQDVQMGTQKLDPESPFLQTHPQNMAALLAYIDRTYGGVDGYIRSCGVEEATIEAIRGKLLV